LKNKLTHFFVRKNTKEYKKLCVEKKQTLKTILFYPEENELKWCYYFFRHCKCQYNNNNLQNIKYKCQYNNRAEVKLQAFVNHTAQRLLSAWTG